jgi:DNA (cytosine-5)-methyltransferase 1
VESLKFIDLFAGLGGFHVALRALGHECVFASEIDPELQRLYLRNFPSMGDRVFGDIALSKSRVPEHDVLCAGFPCQPFSKSGEQLGFRDQTRGTLFHEVLDILAKRAPGYVILENVGNFERHDKGRTWRVVRACLEELGYEVKWAGHREGGGQGLLSPHHLGFPQHRERFFAVASRAGLPSSPFPPAQSNGSETLGSIVQQSANLSAQDRVETSLSDKQIACIEHWNRMLRALPEEFEVQSPLWGDELWERYPFEQWTPWYLGADQLRRALGKRRIPRGSSLAAALRTLPSYARSPRRHFPEWKIEFIKENRAWWGSARRYLPTGWKHELRAFPPSLRKLEWNCRGERRDLWNCVLQFRPSGLRAKRYTSSPALVAMTSTQIPILGPERRFLTRTEGLRLQGFPDRHQLPASRSDAFSALGNAVHVGVAREIARRLLSTQRRSKQTVLAAHGAPGKQPDWNETPARRALAALSR